MSEKVSRDVSETMTQLPWDGLIPVAACLLIGLLAWAAGHRMLRPALLGAGLVLGGVAGWVLAAVLHAEIPAWALAIGGAVALGTAAWLAYRVVIVVMMAALLAMLAGAGTWIAADLGFDRSAMAKPEVVSAEQPVAPGAATPSPAIAPTTTQPGESTDPARGLPEEIGSFVRRAVGEEPDASGTPEAEPQLPAEVPTTFSPDELSEDDMRRQILRFGGQVHERAVKAETTWESAPPGARKAVLGACLLGAILGAAMGLLAPTFSAIVATAALGALLALGSGWIGMTKLDTSHALPESPSLGSWAAIWLITSLAGMVIQWTIRQRATDKPA